MLLGDVVGTTTSTIKHPSMNGRKLLIVQPRMADGASPDGDPVVAIDTVGAGHGETVVLTSDGRFVREVLNIDATPARWTVIGIRD